MATTTSVNTLPNPILNHFDTPKDAPINKKSLEDTQESTLVPVYGPNQINFLIVNAKKLENDEPFQVKILKIEPPPAPPKPHVVVSPIPDKATDVLKRTQQSQKPASAPMSLNKRVSQPQQLCILSPKGVLVPVRVYEKGDANSLLVIFKGKAFCAIEGINYIDYGFVRRGNRFINPSAPLDQVECVVM